ncbi:MAG: ribonuclease HII [Gammaproteobacteria bacterium]|nr:ribonuclease HII [Gammaproteobacteria bacterium]
MNSDLLLAGVDEAGRGPLVGSVVAAAVILNPDKPVAGLADSKKLSESRRQQLAEQIKDSALAWSVASVSAEEIDQINILQATMKAMKLAVEGLSIAPDKVEVDGNRCPDIAYPVEAIVKGDAKVQAISAASILAKVERDRQMIELHQRYPQYGFESHKGYGTKQHIAALQQHGACPLHRRTFSPVKKVL